MDSTAPAQERPISQFVANWLETADMEQNDTATAPLPILRMAKPFNRPDRRPNNSWTTGTTLMDSPSPPVPRSTLGKLKDSSATPLNRTSCLSPAQSTKKNTIRTIFQKWLYTLPKLKGKHKIHPTEIQYPESMPAGVVADSLGNFSVLIERAIRNSPSQTLSTTGICKDIMRTNDWYRIHRKSGWQEMVALQLAINSRFQPVIECRKGEIRRHRSVKWRLTTIESCTQPRSPSCRHPLVSRQSPVELSGDSVTKKMEKPPKATPEEPTAIHSTMEDLEDLEDSPWSATTAINSSTPTTSAIPTYKAARLDRCTMRSAALLSPYPTIEPGEPKESYLDDYGTDFSRDKGKRLLKEAEPPNHSSAVVATFSGPGVKRWELYDKPMEMDLGNTTCNNSAPAGQAAGNPVPSDQPDDAGQGQSSGRGHESGSDEPQGPGRSDDGNRDRKRKRFGSPDGNKNRRRFACVYHKHDPRMYGVRNRRYLVCAGAGFEFTSELIRHLARTHGEYICGRCLQHFDNAEEHNIHRDQCTVRLKCSQEERWAGLWKARFPGIPVPDDPYLSNPLSAPHRLDTRVASVSTYGASGSYSSSTDPSISPPFSGVIFDNADSSISSQNFPVNNNNKQASIPALPTSAILELMECRIDSLEERLPGIEKTLNLVLRLIGSSSDPSIKASIPTSATMVGTAPQRSAVHPSCSPTDNNIHFVGSNSNDSYPKVSHTTNLASNRPSFESSGSGCSRSQLRTPPSIRLDHCGLDSFQFLEGAYYDPLFDDKDNDKDDDIPDFLMPDLDLEAWNNEYNLLSGGGL